MLNYIDIKEILIFLQDMWKIDRILFKNFSISKQKILYNFINLLFSKLMLNINI